MTAGLGNTPTSATDRFANILGIDLGLESPETVRLAAAFSPGKQKPVSTAVDYFVDFRNPKHIQKPSIFHIGG
jgi:hypothetical protein